MEKINVNNPCKIIESKRKRYTSYYNIPAVEAVVLPKKFYGDQILCDVMWKDDAGEVKSKTDLMFDGANLQRLNPMKDFMLYTMWESTTKKESVQTV